MGFMIEFIIGCIGFIIGFIEGFMEAAEGLGISRSGSLDQS